VYTIAKIDIKASITVDLFSTLGSR